MNVFDTGDFDNHEQVIFVGDRPSELQAIIAIHSTALGPALGGLRFWPYKSEAIALEDVLRLSKGMSYKNAMAGIPFGGGKAVVIHDPQKPKSRALLEKLGLAIERQHGRYITGEDVGSTVDDMTQLRKITDHVMGSPIENGGSGDPSPSTALGCFVGIQACVKHLCQSDDLKGARIAVQGLGNVGWNLCQLLSSAGAELMVSDISSARTQRCASELNAKVVDVDEIYDVDADIFAPCALGAVINDNTLPRLKAKIVAGGANNQLATAGHGKQMQDQGILYAPDYVINAGGVIQFAVERMAFNMNTPYDPVTVGPKVSAIHETLLGIFHKSDTEIIPTSIAADCIAENMIGSVDPLQKKVS